MLYWDEKVPMWSYCMDCATRYCSEFMAPTVNACDEKEAFVCRG